MTKEIQLTKGYVALIDDDDYEKVSNYSWMALVLKNNLYAVSRTKKESSKNRKIFRMHQLILGTIGKQACIDHINHNGLDNRKENLRVCTIAQNCSNAIHKENNKFGYKGVCLLGGHHKNKPFRAQIVYQRKHYYLGNFSTIKEAAMAYDKKALEFFGEFACINFPEEVYNTSISNV
jgi:hypothetical protein